MTREDLKAMLQANVKMVTFQKVNGDKRTMRCTLNPSYLPETKPKAIGASPRPENEEVLAVYDLDEKSWRSFRIENILKVEATLQLVK